MPPVPTAPKIFCNTPDAWRAAFNVAARWLWYGFQMVDRVWRLGSGAWMQDEIACLWNDGMQAPWPVGIDWEGEWYFIGHPYPWYWFGAYDIAAYPANVHHLTVLRHQLARMVEHVYGEDPLHIICPEYASKFPDTWGVSMSQIFLTQCEGSALRLPNAFDASFSGGQAVGFCSSDASGVTGTASVLLHEISHLNPLPDLKHTIACAGQQATYYGIEGARFLVEHCPEQTLLNPDNFRFFCECVGRAVDSGHLATWGQACLPAQILPPKKKP